MKVVGLLLGIAVGAVTHDYRLAIGADGIHRVLARVMRHEDRELDASLGQVAGVCRGGVARGCHAELLHAIFFEEGGGQRGGDVFEGVAAAVQVVAIDHHLAVHAVFLPGIFLQKIPLLHRDGTFAESDDVLLVHHGQEVEIVVEVLRMMLRLRQLRDFVIISAIDDIGAFAAALALLVLRKPSGKVGDDFATLGTFQVVFVHLIDN